MLEFLTNIKEILRWQDLFDILLVCIIVYRVLLLIRGTRAVQMLTGFGIILIGAMTSNFPITKSIAATDTTGFTPVMKICA